MANNIVQINSNGSVNVTTQTSNDIVSVITVGPQGPQGPQGEPGDGFPFDGGIAQITGSLQVTGSSIITGSLDVSGGITGSLLGTSSWAINSLTASYALNASNIDTSNLVTTTSFNNFTSSYNTGSFSGSFSGSLFGTSSWAINSLTASFAPNYVLLTQTSSFAKLASINQFTNTNQFDEDVTFLSDIIAGDIAADNHLVYNIGGEITPGRDYWFATASIGKIKTFQNSIEFYNESNKTLQAVLSVDDNSFVIKNSAGIKTALSGANANFTNVVQAGSFIGSLTGSLLGTTSKITVGGLGNNVYPLAITSPLGEIVTASGFTFNGNTKYFNLPSDYTLYMPGTSIVNAGTFLGNMSGNVTGNLTGTSSWASNAVTASNARTASSVSTLNQDVIVNGTLTAYTGSFNTINAEVLKVTYISSSVVYSSGSNTFGSSSANTQTFIGDVVVTGNNFTWNNNTVLTTISTASQAVTASYIQTAQTASYVLNAQTASYVLNAISSSFASTASYILTAQTASYVLTAQTASYVLNAISSSFATTASYALNAGVGPSITGSLLKTASVSSNVLTFTKGDGSTFELTVDTGSGGGGGSVGTLAQVTALGAVTTTPITASIISASSFTGSLFGTSSQAISSSHALTASYALSGGSGGGSNLGSIFITLYDGGANLTTGKKDTPVYVPYNGTCTGWEMLAYNSSNNLMTASCVVDVLSGSFSALPISTASSIAGTEKPTLTNRSSSFSSSLSTWAGLTAGSYIQAEIESVSTGVAKITVAIKVTKS